MLSKHTADVDEGPPSTVIFSHIADGLGLKHLLSGLTGVGHDVARMSASVTPSHEQQPVAQRRDRG